MREETFQHRERFQAKEVQGVVSSFLCNSCCAVHSTRVSFHPSLNYGVLGKDMTWAGLCRGAVIKAAFN